MVSFVVSVLLIIHISLSHSLVIQCGDTKSNTLIYEQVDEYKLSLTGNHTYDITFETCDSSGDVTIIVYNDIDLNQSISAAYCIGDFGDNYDACGVCENPGNPYPEHFTIPEMSDGIYRIQITPYNPEDPTTEYMLAVTCNIINITNYNYIDKNNGSISCGDNIGGSTTDNEPLHIYSFVVNITDNSGIYVQFTACNPMYIYYDYYGDMYLNYSSELETDLRLFDHNWNSLVWVDAAGGNDDNCLYSAYLKFPNKLFNGIYYLEIGDSKCHCCSDVSALLMSGTYEIDVSCDSDTSFADQNEQPLCEINDNTGIYTCECDSELKCEHSIIACLDNFDCNIQCNDLGACRDASILWPSNGTATLLCNGEYACDCMEIPKPAQDKKLIIECNGAYSCEWTTINFSNLYQISQIY